MGLPVRRGIRSARPLTRQRRGALIGVVARLVWVAAALSLAACSANGGASHTGPGSGGSGGAAAGSGGSGGGSGGAAGTGGLPFDAGLDAPTDTTLVDGPGVTNDGAVDATGEACTDAGYTAGPFKRTCAAPTDNECNGSSDTNAAFPNGATGNGFDDDCDGLVDEGCLCDNGVAAGQTKPCWLVPASQADSSGQAVGWCKENSVGTVKCISVISGEFSTPKWDGQCRGAQPPFADDVCAPGDFDCDGVEANSKTHDCTCNTAEVQCPTAPLETQPYPPANALPVIDGTTWIKGVSPSLATNWKWTATGGDCDNILPHPSFQIYNKGNVQGFVAPNGVQKSGLGPQGNQTGLVFGPGGLAGPKLYPAFALSGDYLVKGEFDLGGTHHECTVKVHVRAPGIRAELCWQPMPNDVDLHVARLQNPDTCTGAEGHGWFQTCRADEHADDCYYIQASGCRGFSGNPSAWGYAQSAATACHGWGSRRDPASGCDNPRLDFDNISCDPTIINPNGFLGSGLANDFCGAENINLDDPKNDDRFAVGVHAYSLSGSVKAHVNIYCNGERRLSLGYDPAGQAFPELTESGAEAGGDFWEVATVKAVVDAAGKLTDCQIDPVHSTTPKSVKDGSNDVCVDTNPKNGAPGDETQWTFESDGQYPATADAFCWH